MKIEPSVGLGVTVHTRDGLKPATVVNALSHNRFAIIFDAIIPTWLKGKFGIAPNCDQMPEAHIIYYKRGSWRISGSGTKVVLGIRTTDKDMLNGRS
jgi:hypothetical protein